MAANDVADLLLRIDATTEGLRREMRRAEKTIDTSTGSITKTLKRIDRQFGDLTKRVAKWGIAAGAAGAAFAGAMVRSGLKTADSLAKVSDRLGIATEDLARLRFAAEQTGVSTETLDMALQRMTRRVAEAANGTGEARDAIKELGLSAGELNALSPDETFRRITDAMQGVENQSDRVRLAMKLFDSEGVSLVQTMQGGTQALDEFARQADAAGISLNRLDAAKAEAANDAVNRLSNRFQGFSQELAIEFAPKIVAAVESIEQALSNPANKRAVNNFIEDASGLIKWGLETARVMGFLKDEVFAFFGSIRENDFVRLTDKIDNLKKAIEIDEDSLFPWIRARADRNREELANYERQLKNLIATMNGLEEVTVNVTRKSEDLPRVFSEAAERFSQSSATMDGSLQEIEVTAQRITATLPEITATAEQEAPAMATAYIRGIERMRDGFGDFFQRILVDGKFAFSDLADLFKRTVAEMIATAAANRVMVGVGMMSAGQAANAGGMLGSGGFSLGGIGSAISGFGAGASNLVGQGLFQLGRATGSQSLVGLSGTAFNNANNMTLGGTLAGAGAGLLGGFASNQVFGQTSGIGSGLGGTLGFALGGPLGAGVGSFLGGGIESLFGGNNNGENAGRAQINLGTGMSNIGGVGNTFDQGRVDQVGGLAGFAQQVAGIIGGSSAALDIVSGRSGIRVGGSNFGPGNEAGAIEQIFKQVVYGANGLSDTMKRLIGEFKGTSDQMMAFADAVVSMDRLTSSNPIERLRDSLTGPSSLAQAYEQQIDTIRTLRMNFDGSAVAAQEMNAALQANQSTAMQLAQSLLQVSDQAAGMFGSSAQRIRESVMSEQQLRQTRFQERNQLFNSIGSVSDASELSSISQRINELNNAIFSSLRDPSAEQAEQFASFAEKASDRIEQRSQNLVDQLAKQQERQNRELQGMLRQAANDQQVAATTMLNAANIMASAASSFGAAGFDTPELAR
jgi:hypothetical protein